MTTMNQSNLVSAIEANKPDLVHKILSSDPKALTREAFRAATINSQMRMTEVGPHSQMLLHDPEADAILLTLFDKASETHLGFTIDADSFCALLSCCEGSTHLSKHATEAIKLARYYAEKSTQPLGPSQEMNDDVFSAAVRARLWKVTNHAITIAQEQDVTFGDAALLAATRLAFAGSETSNYYLKALQDSHRCVPTEEGLDAAVKLAQEHGKEQDAFTLQQWGTGVIARAKAQSQDAAAQTQAAEFTAAVEKLTDMQRALINPYTKRPYTEDHEDYFAEKRQALSNALTQEAESFAVPGAKQHFEKQLQASASRLQDEGLRLHPLVAEFAQQHALQPTTHTDQVDAGNRLKHTVKRGL